MSRPPQFRGDLEPRAPLPSRREVLRWVSAAGLLGAASNLSPSAFAGGSPLGSKKLLSIFLRGGNDGLNTLIPLHDAEYFAPSVRPTLRIPAGQALDLGVGGAAFHPALGRAMEVYQAGELAAVARVGRTNSSLSHFANAHVCETAVPQDEGVDEGWIARWSRIAASAEPLAVASVSPQIQRAFLGPKVAAHVPALAQYSLSGSPVAAKILGAGASGLAAAYAGAGPGGNTGYSPAVRATGLTMEACFGAFSALPNPNFASDSFPDDPAQCGAVGLPAAWWAASFLGEVRDALRILAGTPCSVAGVELQGFDHHVGQGGTGGDHAARLLVIGHALRSLRREALQSGLWGDFAVLVTSEFGRTSRENGSGGTDHGRSGVALLAGGGVRGGVHHCDPVSWPSGATLFSADGRYVEHRTDYRVLYAEILERHLGLPSGDLDLVLPDVGSQLGSDFQRLGLFL